MDKTELLINKQSDSFEKQQWSSEDLLPYSSRKDNTFGQYVANVDLIALEPFVETLTGDSVVTICDGRAVESSYLKYKGLVVTATDLCITYLQQAFKKGDVDNFSEQNAENLTFGKEEFDWGFVKAGLHHLPRPSIGIYELLRVSRKGIFILEGHDSYLLGILRNFLTGRDWEPSGNYVYRFREREIEKICLSLDLPGYAIKTTFLSWSRSQEKIEKGTYGYRARIILSRMVNVLFSSQGNNFSVIIFKEAPTEKQISVLRKCSFRYVKLPRNPYLRTPNFS